MMTNPRIVAGWRVPLLLGMRQPATPPPNDAVQASGLASEVPSLKAW